MIFQIEPDPEFSTVKYPNPEEGKSVLVLNQCPKLFNIYLLVQIGKITNASSKLHATILNEYCILTHPELTVRQIVRFTVQLYARFLLTNLCYQQETIAV